MESSDNYVGYAKTVKEGEEGEELVVASVKLLNGQEVSRDILEPERRERAGGGAGDGRDERDRVCDVPGGEHRAGERNAGDRQLYVAGGRRKVYLRLLGYANHRAMDIGAAARNQYPRFRRGAGRDFR